MADQFSNEDPHESIEDTPQSAAIDSSASEMHSESHSRGRNKRHRRSSDMPASGANLPTRPTKAGKTDNNDHNDDDPDEDAPMPDEGHHRKTRPPHHRKRSDQAIDEGRRGRLGSHAYGDACRSDSPFEESEELKQARHALRRSSPPSRGPAVRKENEAKLVETVEEKAGEQDELEGGDEDSMGYRRRGSLPNHRRKYYDLRGVEVGERARAYGADGRRVGDGEVGKQAPRRASRHGRYDSAAVVTYDDDKNQGDERSGGLRMDGATETVV